MARSLRTKSSRRSIWWLTARQSVTGSPGWKYSSVASSAVVLDVAGDAEELLLLSPDQHRVVEEPVELDRRFGHELVDIQAVREFFGVSEIDRALLLGEPAHEQVLGNRSGAHQQRAQPAAHRLLNAQRLLDIGGGDVVAFHEQLAEALPVGRAFDAQLRHRFPILGGWPYSDLCQVLCIPRRERGGPVLEVRPAPCPGEGRVHPELLALQHRDVLRERLVHACIVALRLLPEGRSGGRSRAESTPTG